MANSENAGKRWACVSDGAVDMVVLWDGQEDWQPSAAYVMVELPDGSPVGPGWDYVDGQFIDNRPDPESVI